MSPRWGVSVALMYREVEGRLLDIFVFYKQVGFSYLGSLTGAQTMKNGFLAFRMVDGRRRLNG